MAERGDPTPMPMSVPKPLRPKTAPIGKPDLNSSIEARVQYLEQLLEHVFSQIQSIAHQVAPKPIPVWKVLGGVIPIVALIMPLIIWISRLPTRSDYETMSRDMSEVKQSVSKTQVTNDVLAKDIDRIQKKLEQQDTRQRAFEDKINDKLDRLIERNGRSRTPQ